MNTFIAPPAINQYRINRFAAFVLLVITSLLAASFLIAGEPAELLVRAADGSLPERERELAARRLLESGRKSLPVIFDALAGDDMAHTRRRQIAALLAGEAGFPEAEEPLARVMAGRDYFSAEAARKGLARLYSKFSEDEIWRRLRTGKITSGGPTDEKAWLDALLHDAKSRAMIRAVALEGLARKAAGTDSAYPAQLAAAVWEGLEDGDRQVRLAAVAAAENSRLPEAPGRLASLLVVENNPAILRAALRALAKMRPEDYGEVVERQIDNADALVAVEALGTLHALGYRGVIVSGEAKSLAGMLHNSSSQVRLRAVELMGETNDPEAIAPLKQALSDPVWRVRLAAVRALGDMRARDASGELTAMLEDPHPEVRTAAALSLDRLGVMGAAASLRRNLGQGVFRMTAAEGLGKMRDRKSVPDLLALIDDGDLSVAGAAVDALGKIGDESAGPALFGLLRSTSRPALADATRAALYALYRDDPGETSGSWESWAARNRLQGK